MASPQRNSEWFRFYSGAFLRDVHQLLAWGYYDAQQQNETHSLALEENITGEIVQAIKRRLDDLATPRKFTTHYFVDDESHVRESDKLGKERQRIDIVIVCSAKLPRPEFMFEAKLLRKNGFPISLYIGDGGMQCFIRGEYAASYPAAGMIGYIQSDDANRWFNELERKFNEDMHDNLRIRSSLKKIEVLSALKDEWVSRHYRENNTDIQLFHIFLDCTSNIV